MESVNDFYEGAREIIDSFERFLQENELIRRVQADHICYKCRNSESFIAIRSLFESPHESDAAGSRINQSYISKRRIALITLNKLIETSVGNIGLLELSDQRPDGSQEEGFDHIEIYAKRGTYDELVDYLSGRGLEIKKIERPHHTTHDIPISGGFLVRLTRESLYDKVGREVSEEKPNQLNPNFNLPSEH
ncbi:MAG: VOC family protein [Nanoarchaeota archaeon]